MQQSWRGGAWLAMSREAHGPDVLLPDERVLASQYDGERLRQFCSGRHLARQALARIGFSQPLPAIGRGRFGEPLWPAGFVGSISHVDDAVAVVLGPAAEWRALAVDIERVGRLTADLWPVLFTAGEQVQLSRADPARQDFLATACFSCKEVFMKLPSPCRDRVEGYHDVEVSECNGQFRLMGTSDSLQRHFGQSVLAIDVGRHEGLVVAVAGLAVEEA